ncbi:MAG TPA: hypothetical protein VF119_00815 [Candidatus Limnocylindrales bacterium]
MLNGQDDPGPTRAVAAARAEAARARAEAARARADATHARTDATSARAEAARARAEADRVAGSLSYIVGRLLVGTVRRPTRIVHLPRELARAWRRRHDRDRSSQTTDPDAGTDRSTAIATARGGERYFLTDRAVSIRPRTRPVILGVLTEATATALRRDAIVDRVTPNDALLVLERSEPDIVLIETAAFAPSRPWAYTGDPAAVERTAVVAELLERANGVGRASVLVRGRDRSESVGLSPLEPRFDLVLDERPTGHGDEAWSRGVDLATFVPRGPTAQREKRAAYLVDRYPPESRRERDLSMALLRAGHELGVLEVGLDIDGPAGPEDLPDDVRRDVVGRLGPLAQAAWYRRTAIAIPQPLHASVDAPSARTLEQLAAGSRLIVPSELVSDQLAGAPVTVVPTPADASAALAEACAAGPPSSADRRALLRAIHQRWATPVMLARLTGHFLTAVDPLDRRTATAVAEVSVGTDLAPLVDGLLAQMAPPRQLVVLDEGAWSDVADAAVRAAGITTVRVRRARAGDQPVDGPPDVPVTAWLLHWPVSRPVSPTYLIDLLVGAALEAAEVVGYGPGPSFAYVNAADPDAAMVRWDAIADLGRGHPVLSDVATLLATPAAIGWRVLSVGPEVLG